MSANVISVEFRGLNAAITKMKLLPDKLQSKGLRTAMRKGAKIVQDAATANMRTLDDPDTRRKIYRNVTTIFASRTSKRTKSVVMMVGVRGGAKQRTITNYDSRGKVRRRTGLGKMVETGGKGNPGGDTWYWRFLEFGVPSRGIPAKQPMLNALRSNVQRATDVIAAQLEDEITKAVKSL